MKFKTLLCVSILVSVLLSAGCSNAQTESAPVEQPVATETPASEQAPPVISNTEEAASPVVGVSVPQTEIVSLHSNAGERDYDIFIALPQVYEFSGVTYPVLYLLDGDITFIMVTEYTRFLSGDNQMPEMIVVGIDNHGRRSRDFYLPINPDGVAAFLSFVLDDLIPYIDQNYRTDPADRTLVGGADGGLFSLYALFSAPDTFQHYIINNPSLSSDGPVFELEEQFARENADLPVQIFMSVGDRETWLIPLFNQFIENLESRNYPGLQVHSRMIADAGHTVTYIHGLLEGIRYHFQR